jgi:hypothetical protein
MNFPLPPQRHRLIYNARQFVADWQMAGALARFFMLSQVLSCVLMAVCAAGAAVAAVAGQVGPYLGLLAASAICFAQTLGAWNVLKRRFLVRYELL